MTEQEALEAFFAEWDRQANEYGASLTREQRDCAEEAWNAALAWLRSQGEPVGRFNWETGEFEFLVPWDYETHNMKPLHLAPQPAIPDGWKLVPMEPTEEMSACIELSTANSNNDIYRAMLFFAPQPSK